MSILTLCDKRPVTVPPEATVADAVRTMVDNRVGAVAVTDNVGKIVGIFTERDVLRKVMVRGKDPKLVAINDVMSAPVTTASIESTAADAMKLMLQSRFRHIPIVDTRGGLLGMLSLRGLVEATADRVLSYLERNGS